MTIVKSIVHRASGAILGSTMRAPPGLPEGLMLIDGNHEAGTVWIQNGEPAVREVASVVLAPDPAAVGGMVSIEKPPGAWVRLPDGTLSDATWLSVPAGYKILSVTLIGRYRGEAHAEVEEP